jgi:hypothetical protein
LIASDAGALRATGSTALCDFDVAGIVLSNFDAPAVQRQRGGSG